MPPSRVAHNSNQHRLHLLLHVVLLLHVPHVASSSVLHGYSMALANDVRSVLVALGSLSATVSAQTHE